MRLHTCLLPALIAAISLAPAVRATAQTPTVMASGLNAPGNVFLDGTTVYWGDDNGKIYARGYGELPRSSSRALTGRGLSR